MAAGLHLDGFEDACYGWQGGYSTYQGLGLLVGVKIAAVTASTFGSEREEALAAGADDYIQKPIGRARFFDCMARHLSLRRIYSKPREENPAALDKDDLKSLPRELIDELTAAVVALDETSIREAIARISDRDAAVGRKYTYVADRFAYTVILKAADLHDGSANGSH